MPRSAHLPPNEVNDPASLPESARDYYRSTWGFDPVTDCQVLSKGGLRYEECFSLSQDLPLRAVGVTICARVDWVGEEIHNRIVFRRTDAKGRRRRASVECTHTVVYAGPASDALAFADGLDQFTPPTQPHRARLMGQGKLVTLPPWEHFVALKSFVAAVADMGVIALLRQSIVVSTGTEEGLPFGFNAEMQEQVARALRAIAPRAMVSIYRDLTCEFLDTRPPADQIGHWMKQSAVFEGKSNRKHWGLLLRHLDRPTLIQWFRHTDKADKLQDRLFTNPALLAKAQATAPDLPWGVLYFEWEARRAAKVLEPYDFDHPVPSSRYLQRLQPVEIWARTPFCGYTFPRDILETDTADARRARVKAFLGKMKNAYISGRGEWFDDQCLGWVKYVSSHLDTMLAAPFPVGRARRKPIRHWDATLNQQVEDTPPEPADSIKLGDHRTRRDVVLTCTLPPELQESLVTHWDFATRLALVGNPDTIPAVLATLAQDPQPCVRLAAAARLRRGVTSLEPLFGEMLDPGEVVWLLAAHPDVAFQFGVTAWGDGSQEYNKWFKARLREDWGFNGYQYLSGELYAWAYSEGIFGEEIEGRRHGSHLVYYGLTPYACGNLPCLCLGLYFIDDNILR